LLFPGRYPACFGEAGDHCGLAGNADEIFRRSFGLRTGWGLTFFVQSRKTDFL